MADATDSKSVTFRGVRVQVPPPVPPSSNTKSVDQSIREQLQETAGLFCYEHTAGLNQSLITNLRNCGCKKVNT